MSAVEEGYGLVNALKAEFYRLNTDNDRLRAELATCRNATLEEAAMNLEQRAALIDDSERACHGYDKHGYADFLSAAANAILALKVAAP